MLNNDWIVANINNPDYSTEMFKMKGIDTDNTQMLKEESYLKSNFIINNPAFADNNGNFNKDKFHDYYQQQATKWGELQKDKSVHTVYDMFDVRQAPGDQIYNPFTGTTQGMKTDKQNPLGSFIKLTSNPTNQGVGISGFQEISKQSKSTREIAQGQNIFDSSTGKFLNETPDSISLFSNPIKYIKQIFSEPLVLATYDSDGESIDPISGKKLKHSKGEIKLNSNGKPYYETLNGRNPATKQVLSMGDIVTSEASSLNKYDFIDSDDMDKSVRGTILKNVASVLPLAVPYVGEAYSAGLVVRELAKTTPMLYGMIKSLFSDKPANSQFLNSLQGRATAMSGSVSDAGQSAMWTWEGVFNMMGDVATQWGQQKAVANWTKKLITGKQDLSKVAEEEAKALYESKLQSVLNNANTAEDKYKALSLYGMEEGQIAKILEQEGKAVGDAWKQTSIGSAALRKTFDVYKPRIEKLNRLGANASLAYMALVSNTDVYQSMLDAGATPREAAAVALGSTLGMYTVDRLGIGEMFFDELAKNDMRQIRTALLGEKENWAKALGISTKNIPENTNKFKKLILSGRDKMVKALQDYADDIKYVNLISAEEFGATIEAYTYPDEFAQCDGSASIATGVFIGQQTRKAFGLAYKTVLGNDTDGDAHGYKLHIIYGANASPSEKNYATINDNPEAITFSWELSTTPVSVNNFKPTASITIDSTKADAQKIKVLEEILYGKNPTSENGNDGVNPRLPLPNEIATLMA